MNLAIIMIIMLFNTLMTAFASLFLKKGSAEFRLKLSFDGILKIIENRHVLLGLFLYVLSTVFFIYLLRTEKLSLLYPLSSLSYIFVTIISVWLLKEKLNVYRVCGISMIIIGVVLVTL